MFPQQVIDSMKCSLCKYTLSVFPIHSYGDKDMSTCGRCPVQEEFLPQREHLYEKLAAHIEFSCRFKDNGCIEKLKPADLKEHENACPHRQCLCPMIPIGVCKWRGNYKDLYEHYAYTHEDLTFQNSCCEVPTRCDYKQNYVIVKGDETFIVQLSCNTKIGRCFLNVLCCDIKPNKKKYSYCVNFIYKASKFSSESRNVAFRQLSAFTETAETAVINIGDVLKARNSPDCFRCEIDITETAVMSSKQTDGLITDECKLLSVLECPICFEYMVPPIFQCYTGHSYCASHKAELTACPTCQSKVGSIRNYDLEKITNFLRFPCKYIQNGCSHTSNTDSIKAHEVICTYGPHKCIIPDCQWEDTLSKLKRHLNDEHKDIIIETNFVTYVLDEDMQHECIIYVMFAYEKIFRLVFDRMDDRFDWQLQVVGDNNDYDQYMLELDFTSERKEKIYITSRCEPFSDDMNEELSATLDITDLKKFIVDDLLTFKVRVIQTV